MKTKKIEDPRERRGKCEETGCLKYKRDNIIMYVQKTLTIYKEDYR